MFQLMHILKKDCRYLRFEFLIYALFLLWHAWTEIHADADTLNYGVYGSLPGEASQVLSLVLMAVAAAYLIARLIHAEAIPGDNSFWLTRPYSWKSLLGAKLLLLLLCVSLPMLLVRLVTFHFQGFPFFPGVWQLLWSHFVLMAVIALPIAALSALTSGLLQFVISVLILIPVAAFIELDTDWLNFWPPATLWFREAIAATGLTAIAVSVLYSQYKKRETNYARGFALCAGTLVGIFCFSTPWSVAMTVNGWLAAPMTAESSPGVGIGPQVKFFNKEASDRVNTRLPVIVRRIPTGYSAELQRILVTFRGAAGVRREWFETGPAEPSAQGTIYRAMGSLDRSFFDAAQGKPMTVGVSLDVILFPPVQAQTVQLSNKFMNVVGGVQCRGALLNPGRMSQSPSGFDAIECRSAFDWPEARFGSIPESPAEPIPTLAPSHSPFYGGALSSLSSVFHKRASYFYRDVDEVTLTAQGPPMWYHRDFEIREVQLGDTINIQ